MSHDSFFFPESKQSNCILIFLRLIPVKDTKYRPRTWAILSLYSIVLASYFRFSPLNFRLDRRSSLFSEKLCQRNRSPFQILDISLLRRNVEYVIEKDPLYLWMNRNISVRVDLNRNQTLYILTTSTLTVHSSVTRLILIFDHFRRSLPSFSSRDTGQVSWMKRTSSDSQWNMSRSSSSSLRYHSWENQRRYRWSSSPLISRLHLQHFIDRIIRIVFLKWSSTFSSCTLASILHVLIRTKVRRVISWHKKLESEKNIFISLIVTRSPKIFWT